MVSTKETGWYALGYTYMVTAPQAGYAVDVLLGGQLIEKVEIEIGNTVSIFVWSVVAKEHALVRRTFGFGFARVPLGLGESEDFLVATNATVE